MVHALNVGEQNCTLAGRQKDAEGSDLLSLEMLGLLHQEHPDSCVQFVPLPQEALGQANFINSPQPFQKIIRFKFI